MADLWEGEAPSVHLIKEHYAEYQLDKWDHKRIGRLCRTLHCTIPELFALAAIFRAATVAMHWRRLQSGKALPPTIALHFAKLERFGNEAVFCVPCKPDPLEIQTALLVTR